MQFGVKVKVDLEESKGWGERLSGKAEHTYDSSQDLHRTDEILILHIFTQIL